MICSVQEIPIYYEQYGSGKPILCIHGYSVDHKLMTGCLEPIFDKMQGYQRIYVDLPGMGKTPSALWLEDADKMLELIHDFVNEVIPDENFLIIGESYGGYLSLGLMHDMQRRIDGAMLICPVITTKNRKLPARRILWKENSLKEIMGEAGMEDFMDMAVIATPEIYEKYKNDILSGTTLADMDFLSRYESGGYSFTFEDDLKAIEFHKPMSILTGRQDHIVGYADAFEILESFPRATFAILDCAGHNLQIENKPLFDQHVNDWIWRVGMSI